MHALLLVAIKLPMCVCVVSVTVMQVDSVGAGE